MNALGAHILDTLLTYKKTKQIEETKEPAVVEESKSVGHAVNAYHFIYNVENNNF